MVMTYLECLKKYNTDYQIKKAIEEDTLFKLENGLYSDRRYIPRETVLMKKYPHAVFTMNSALYYHGLTDEIPQLYYLETDKNAAKISDAGVKQIFDNYKSLDMGTETKMYNGSEIKIFNRERVLVEFLRSKKRQPLDFYKEVIRNYRRIVYDLDFQKIEEYALALPKTEMVLEAVQMEVL